MISRTLLRFAILAATLYCFVAVRPALADSSHARIVRLSLIQGDVRFAREVKGDPLESHTADWEAAVLNLPLRQGYVIATDSGRAEVEFENGAMAFLSANTVLEFYDLSLSDGELSTRLVLRQGSASFYVNPSRGAYFSVTGGDFTVEANGKTSFRMDNYDDASTVNVTQGRTNVLLKDKSQPLQKNESLSVRAGAPEAFTIARGENPDEFDKWVSGRVDTVQTATNASLQYNNYDNSYTSGFSDLYTYGSWFPVAGYGYGWRPFGVGLGWSPFDYGSWNFVPGIGWAFIGNQPWGWLPYHYGGWIFQPGAGWIWSPVGVTNGGRPGRWSPVTATWVRSGTTVGIVPTHPMDGRSKTPVNLAQGVIPVTGRGFSAVQPVTSGEKWKTIKSAPRDVLVSTAAARSAPPQRVSRTLATTPSASRAATAGRDSSIVYDRQSHRFVNSDVTPAAQTREANREASPAGAPPAAGNVANAGNTPPTAGASSSTTRVATVPSTTSPRGTAPGRTMTPPPAPSRTFTPPSSRNTSGDRAASRGNSGSSSSGSGLPVRSAPSPAPMPRSSPPSGGGRPH